MQRFDERRRRNSKLESFLKRSLPTSLHEDVRWYEPVIIRQGEQLGYKNLIVTGEQVYVADTQPRAITSLFQISQIVKVYLVHDVPEFLGGGLQERTTHTAVLLQSKLPRPKKPSPPSSILNSDEAIHETDEERDESVPVIKEKLSKPHVKKERKFGKAGLMRRRLSQGTLDYRSTDLSSSESSNDTDSISISNKKCNGLGSPNWLSLEQQTRSFDNGVSSRLRHKRNSLPSSNPSQLFFEDGSSQTPLKKYSVPRSSDTPRHLGKSGHLTPSLTDLLNKVAVGRPSSSVARSVTPEPPSRHEQGRCQSAMENYHREFPLTLHLPTRSRSVLDKPIALHRTKVTQRHKSVHSQHVVDDQQPGGSFDQIHIYTLSRSTVLFNLLNAFWISILTNDTKHFDINGCCSPIDNRYKSYVSLKKEPRQLERKFNELLDDITKSKTIEDHFSHINELRNGIDKYPQVKKIFWKDNEMLLCLRRLLTKYCECDTIESEEPLQLRQNQIEIIVLILNTITSCFTDTQLCQSKLKVIGNKELLEGLIKEVMHLPNIPGNSKLTCSRWLTDYREFCSYAWMNLPECELLKLIQEVIMGSVRTLYSILQSYQELTWDTTNSFTLDYHHKFNIPSLYLLFQKAHIENWMKYAIPQLLSIITLSRSSYEDDLSSEASESTDVVKCQDVVSRNCILRKDYLTGKEIVCLHEFLTVLKYLVDNNSAAKSFCLKQYKEELRYLLQERVIGALLPSPAALKPQILTLVSEVSQLLLTHGFSNRESA